MIAPTWDGPQKQSVRNALFFEPKGFRKTAWLTGYQLLDIDLATKNGFIANDAKITIVERNVVNYNAILAEVSKKYPAAEVILGNIESQNFKELDFLNLDLCGMLSDDMCAWLRGLSISKGGSIYLNLCYAKRISSFMQEANKLIKGKYLNLFEHVVNKYNIFDVNIAVQVVLLLSALRDYEFTLFKPIYYRDNVISMTTFRLVKLCQCVPVFPDLLTELGVRVLSKTIHPKQEGVRVMSVPTSKEVTAALLAANGAAPAIKAHAIRKLKAYTAEKINEGKNPFSHIAAIQAWVTRTLEANGELDMGVIASIQAYANTLRKEVA